MSELAVSRSFAASVLIILVALFCLAVLWATVSAQRGVSTAERRYRISGAGRGIALSISLTLMGISYGIAAIAFLNLQNLNHELTSGDYGEIVIMCFLATVIAIWTAVPPILEWALIIGDEIIWNPALGRRQVIPIPRVTEASLGKHANSMGIIMHVGSRASYVKASMEAAFWDDILSIRPAFPFTAVARKALKIE